MERGRDDENKRWMMIGRARQECCGVKKNEGSRKNNL
jgi:hypothetical protein